MLVLNLGAVPHFLISCTAFCTEQLYSKCQNCGAGGEQVGDVGEEGYIYIKVLSTGDVFYSRVYMFYVYLSSDCKVLCNN